MRQHGTYAKYVIDKCRCAACRNANRLYEQERKRRQAIESFHPERALWVDAAPVRRHVRSLMASGRGATDGVGLKRIAKVSGVSQGALWKLVYGKRRADGSQVPSQRVHRDTAAKLLAVTRHDMALGASVPAAPVWVLVEEIIAWYDAEVGTVSGRGTRRAYGGKAWLGRHLSGNPEASALQLSRSRISVKHARMVAALHDQLAREHESFRWRYCNCPANRAEHVA